MAEKENIQAEQVSKEEQVSPEVKPEDKKEEPKVEPQPQPLTEERLQQILAQDRERTRQSSRDIVKSEIEEANRRVKRAEADTLAYKSSFDNLDEDAKKDAELNLLRSQGKQYQSFMQEEDSRRRADSYRQTLQTSLVENVKALGIDPDNKDIDWAENETDFLTGRSKFDASVAKILKEEKGVTEKKMTDDFKVLEAGLRKDLGLDKVDTTTTASGSDSDAEFMSKFGKGDVPYSKESKERAEKLMKK